MTKIVVCLNCGQKASVSATGPKTRFTCPACHAPLESAAPPISSKRSVFELVTWAVAVVVLLPAVYFFFWLFTSNTIKTASNAEHEPGSAPQGLVATTSPQEKSGSPFGQPRPGSSPGGSQPDPHGEDKRGEIFMGLMGYTKGMEWAANYGRVPTRAEYEAIVATVVAMGADDSNQALTEKLREAFLEAFRSGCKAGLDQQRPAF